MPRLDVPTMFATGTALLVMLAALFALYKRQGAAQHGSGHWALSSALAAAGYWTYAASTLPLPPIALRAAGSVLALAGFEALRSGLNRFLGRDERPLPHALFLACCGAAYLFFLIGAPNTAARVALFGTVSGYLQGRAAAACYSLRNGPLRREGLLTGAGLAAGAAAVALRAARALPHLVRGDPLVLMSGQGESLALMALLTLNIFALLTLPLLQARRLRLDLEEALLRVRRLEGIVPICMFCKRIRDEGQHWHQLEKYLSERTEANFSHGLCPDCEHKLA